MATTELRETLKTTLNGTCLCKVSALNVLDDGDGYERRVQCPNCKAVWLTVVLFGPDDEQEVPE